MGAFWQESAGLLAGAARIENAEQPMLVEDTATAGVKIVTPKIHGDARGFFSEVYNRAAPPSLRTSSSGSRNEAAMTLRSDILGQGVTQGRVAYLACENPDDIRMRFMIGPKTCVRR